MASFKEFQLNAGDGLSPRHVYLWQPEESPQAVLQIVHGVSEHIMRYEALAQFLVGQGYAVIGHDHLGHGKTAASEEERGYFAEKKGWDTLVTDVHSVREACRKELPDTPYFIMGHSMGSFVVRTYMYTYPNSGISGYILSGTGQPAGMMLSGGRLLAWLEQKRHGGTYRSERLYQLSMGAYSKAFQPSRTENDWISSVPEEVDLYDADPLTGGRPTVNLMYEMLGGMKRNANPNNLARMNRNVPVLFLYGGADPVGENGKGVERVAALFTAAGYEFKNLTMKKYPEKRHELFHEDVKDQVMDDLYRWMEQKNDE